MLAQNGATLVASSGVYRVLPTAAAAAGIAGGAGTAGGMMVPLRYAAADDLAKVLAPYVQGGAKLVAVPSSNSLVISGEPAQRDALENLVRAFDIDVLAGQSYALFPADQRQRRGFRDRPAAGVLGQSQRRPVGQPDPCDPAGASVNAVLVVANTPRYLADAQGASSRWSSAACARRMRTWHVYYIQNSTANDTAYILQQAFTPEQRHRPADRARPGPADQWLRPAA